MKNDGLIGQLKSLTSKHLSILSQAQWLHDR